jgi:hypothetical protein
MLRDARILGSRSANPLFAASIPARASLQMHKTTMPLMFSTRYPGYVNESLEQSASLLPAPPRIVGTRHTGVFVHPLECAPDRGADLPGTGLVYDRRTLPEGYELQSCSRSSGRGFA